MFHCRSRLRHCLCLVCVFSTAFVAETVPFLAILRSHPRPSNHQFRRSARGRRLRENKTLPLSGVPLPSLRRCLSLRSVQVTLTFDTAIDMGGHPLGLYRVYTYTSTSDVATGASAAVGRCSSLSYASEATCEAATVGLVRHRLCRCISTASVAEAVPLPLCFHRRSRRIRRLCPCVSTAFEAVKPPFLAALRSTGRCPPLRP